MLEDLPDGWQSADIQAALSHVTRFNLAIDCGAHRGTVTAQLLQRFKRVVAIEPSELAERIPYEAEIIRAALGASSGVCSMQHGTENTGQRHVVAGDDTQVITLDSLGLAPDFIKLDIEGMEYHALLGGEATIRAHKPVLMVEDNGLCERYGVTHGECQRLLESWGAKMVEQRNKDYIYTW